MRKSKRIIIAVIVAVVLLTIIALSYILAVEIQKKRERDIHREAIKKYTDDKLAIYRAENEKYEDYEVDVAFIGDSLTDFYNLGEYYPQYLTSNRGIGGDTTFMLEERLEVSVYDLKPKVVVMLIGANNCSTMLENYERILEGLRENLPETEIVLLSLTSMSGEWGKNNHTAAYNNIIIELLAEKYGYEFVDLYSPLLDVKTGEIRSEYAIDGCHLTPAGYEVVTNEVTPVLEGLLGK